MFTRMRKIAHVTIAVLVAFGLAACGAGGTNGNPAPQLVGRGQLLGATQGGTVSTAGVLALMGVVNANSVVKLVSIPLYPVSFYRVTYQTLDPAGNLTVASGLLLVPVKGAGRISPLLSWQHATLTQEKQAPSYADGTTTGTPSEAQLGFINASLGYIVIMPDYLGFGAAKSIFHPYVQQSTLASASIDMIRASKTFLSQNGIGYNTQLFLGGYSEGGYATLATQREMETNLATEFTITASEPGSGPYDVSNTASAVFATTNLAGVTDAGAIAFLLKSYDLYYNNPSQLATYFTPGTVLNCVNADFTSAPTYGTDPTLGTFDACIGNTTITASILNQSFLTSYTTGGQTGLRRSSRRMTSTTGRRK